MAGLTGTNSFEVKEVLMSFKIESSNLSSVKVGWEGSLNIDGTELREAGFVSTDGKARRSNPVR